MTQSSPHTLYQEAASANKKQPRGRSCQAETFASSEMQWPKWPLATTA